MNFTLLPFEKGKCYIGIIFFKKCYFHFIVHIYIFEIFYRTKAKHSGGLLVDDMARERGASCYVNKSHGRKQGDYAFFLLGNPF